MSRSKPVQTRLIPVQIRSKSTPLSGGSTPMRRRHEEGDPLRPSHTAANTRAHQEVGSMNALDILTAVFAPFAAVGGLLLFGLTCLFAWACIDTACRHIAFKFRCWIHIRQLRRQYERPRNLSPRAR